MKILKKCMKSIIVFTLAITLSIPLNIINLGPVQAADATFVIDDDTFVPFRDQIPNYLSRNSSYKSDVVKKIWAKVFYEEKNGVNYVSYNHAYAADGSQIPNYYLGIGGVEKQLTTKITYTAGDFEAFFGNALEANTEFLGQMFGIPGYEALGTKADGNAYLKQVIATYLSKPEIYTYLTQSICNLTKHGKYIGSSRTSANNELKSASYNGVTADIYVLTTLASLYEGDGSETYLSDEQVAWLKSYQRYLYDDYCDRGSSSLAKKYSPIYDLIARSSDASNNYRGKGQEFFNYVEKTGIGAGAWCNQISGVNVSSLQTVGSIGNMFALSNGYCVGHRSDCVNTAHCKHINNGGRATDYDTAAYYTNAAMSSSSLLRTYITSNSSTNSAYQNEDDGWVCKHKVKHDKSGNSLYYSTTDYLGSPGADLTIQGQCCGGRDAYHTSCTAPTLTADIVIGTNYFKKNGVSFTYSVSQGVMTGWSVISNGVNVSHLCSLSGTTLNYSKLNKTQRANAVFRATYTHTGGGSCNPANCISRDSNGWCALTPCDFGGCSAIIYNSNIAQTVKRDDCVINGHKYTSQIEWSKDMKTANVLLFCQKNVDHEKQLNNLVPTVTTTATTITYTLNTHVYDPETGKEITFSKTVSKNGGNVSETVPLNSSNTSGQLYSSYRETNYVVHTYASASTLIGTSYNLGTVEKNASTTITGTKVLSGVVKPGARSIKLNGVFSASLDNLDIRVYNNRNQLIADNHDSTKPITNAYFIGENDYDLQTCYITITASVSTHTEHNHYGWVDSSVIPPDAIATIQLQSITVNY